MKQQLENIRQLSLEQIANAATPAEIDDIRVRVLGKKGEVTAVLKQMGSLSAEERPIMGQIANSVRAVIEEALDARKAVINAQVTANLACMQNTVNTLSGLTKTVIPIASICPEPMARYNSWVAPTTETPAAG